MGNGTTPPVTSGHSSGVDTTDGDFTDWAPVLTDPEQVLRSGAVLEDVGNTVAHNLYRDEADTSRFERRASNTCIPKAAVPEFRQFIEDEGQAFLERVDAWLSAHEDRDAKDTVRLGLGAYWIENNNNEGTPS